MSETKELLKGDRSFSNESNGKEVYGCLATDGVVDCYFPTAASFNRNGPLFKASADLLEALCDCVTEHGALAERSHEYALRRLATITETALAAIAKAKGEAC